MLLGTAHRRDVGSSTKEAASLGTQKYTHLVKSKLTLEGRGGGGGGRGRGGGLSHGQLQDYLQLLFGGLRGEKEAGNGQRREREGGGERERERDEKRG